MTRCGCAGDIPRRKYAELGALLTAMAFFSGCERAPTPAVTPGSTIGRPEDSPSNAEIDRLRQLTASKTLFILSDQGQGSGIVLLKDGLFRLVLTNGHVISKVGTAASILGPTSERPVQAWCVYGVDKTAGNKIDPHGHDYALLVARDEEDRLGDAVVASRNPPRLGQFCMAVGNPRGHAFEKAEGRITGIDAVETGTRITHNAFMTSGNSGGGLFDRQGHLLGINTGGGDKTGIAFDFSLPRSTWEVSARHFKRFSDNLDRVTEKVASLKTGMSVRQGDGLVVVTFGHVAYFTFLQGTYRYGPWGIEREDWQKKYCHYQDQPYGSLLLRREGGPAAPIARIRLLEADRDLKTTDPFVALDGGYASGDGMLYLDLNGAECNFDLHVLILRIRAT